MDNNKSKMYGFRLTPIEQSIFDKNLKENETVREFIYSTFLRSTLEHAYNNMQALKKSVVC